MSVEITCFQSKRSSAPRGPVHGEDVLRGYISLKVVCRSEEKTSSGRHRLDQFVYALLDLVWSSVWQEILLIDTSGKAEAIAKLGLELPGVHALGTNLQGIENVDTDIDQFGDEFAHRAAGVLVIEGTVGLRDAAHLDKSGADELAPLRFSEKKTALGAVILAYTEKIDPISGRFVESPDEGEIEGHDARPRSRRRRASTSGTSR